MRRKRHIVIVSSRFAFRSRSQEKEKDWGHASAAKTTFFSLSLFLLSLLSFLFPLGMLPPRSQRAKCRAAARGLDVGICVRITSRGSKKLISARTWICCLEIWKSNCGLNARGFFLSALPSRVSLALLLLGRGRERGEERFLLPSPGMGGGKGVAGDLLGTSRHEKSYGATKKKAFALFHARPTNTVGNGGGIDAVASRKVALLAFF